MPMSAGKPVSGSALATPDSLHHRPCTPAGTRPAPGPPTGRTGRRTWTRGGTPRIVATGIWGQDEAETLARLSAWNRPIHRIRGRIEKIFGTWKRSYGLRRIRWRGLAKAAIQIHLTAIAYNLKRCLTITAMA